ncbi:MAG: glycosyltransferase [Synergistaceae bacterium]|nr:glycosyltransferase [Synergistaceae bacterium]
MILAAITTHKREPQMLERAVKSVVNQTYKDWHLLIVDDSPADYEYRDEVKNMAEGWCARDSRITYMQHDKNYGSQRARNNALKYALENNYEFIAYLDDDDEWLPEKLEKQIKRFNERDENTALVYCWSWLTINGEVREYISDGIEKPLYEGNVYDKLLVYCWLGTCSNPLIRVKSFITAGGWDETVPARQDWEAWLRIAKLYEVGCVGEFLLTYHLHEGEHIAGNPVTQSRGIEKIIEKNKDYLITHKYEYWQILTRLRNLYARSGQHRKSFAATFKIFSLQPLRLRKNFRVMLSSIYRWLKDII